MRLLVAFKYSVIINQMQDLQEENNEIRNY